MAGVLTTSSDSRQLGVARAAPSGESTAVSGLIWAGLAYVTVAVRLRRRARAKTPHAEF